MNSQQPTGMSNPLLTVSIVAEAAQWIVALQASTFSEEDPYRDVATRDEAFVDWIRRSALHLLIFMEMTEVVRRLKRLDKTAMAQIRTLLLQENARRSVNRARRT